MTTQALRAKALDVIALVKPNIMVMALLTAAGAMSLAPGTMPVGRALVLLAGTALIVGAANTLNMWLERDIDCLMTRTKDRPLPAGRMEPGFALALGVAQAFVAVPTISAVPASSHSATGIATVPGASDIAPAAVSSDMIMIRGLTSAIRSAVFAVRTAVVTSSPRAGARGRSRARPACHCRGAH